HHLVDISLTFRDVWTHPDPEFHRAHEAHGDQRRFQERHFSPPGAVSARAVTTASWAIFGPEFAKMDQIHGSGSGAGSEVGRFDQVRSIYDRKHGRHGPDPARVLAQV